MSADRLRAYLDSEGMPYELHEHARAVTSQQLAAAEHVSGWLVAKPVMLWAGGHLVMAVLPAPMEVDLDKACGALDVDGVRLATEDEFATAFPDCETGAEPPFGHLYDVPMYIDESLVADPHIVFRCGSHVQTMRMAMDDYLGVARPTRVEVGVLPVQG